MESSKFKQKEIIGFTYIDGKRVTVLRMGVKRSKYTDSIDPTKLEEHLNQELIALERWTEYYKKVVGLDDFTNE